MSKIFGGRDNSSQRAQIAANRNAQRFIEKQMAIARGDVRRLIPQAIDAQRQGFQGALDIFEQAMPLQKQQFREGNMAAQQRLMDAQGGIEAALMGTELPPLPSTPTQIGLGADYSQGVMLPEAQEAFPEPAPNELPNLADILANLNLANLNFGH